MSTDHSIFVTIGVSSKPIISHWNLSMVLRLELLPLSLFDVPYCNMQGYSRTVEPIRSVSDAYSSTPLHEGYWVEKGCYSAMLIPFNDAVSWEEGLKTNLHENRRDVVLRGEKENNAGWIFHLYLY